jgi:hypothetical protein
MWVDMQQMNDRKSRVMALSAPLFFFERKEKKDCKIAFNKDKIIDI